jgi:hypothetical protein
MVRKYEEGEMAQEQAKSPVATAPGAKDDGTAALDATTQSPGGNTSIDADYAAVDLDADIEKKLSLAERLRAEQRKTSEIKMEDTRVAEPADTVQSDAGRPLGRPRRPAGPAQRRIAATAANDDLPSIGGLIFALQQKPSKSPFLVALVASLIWFVVGGVFSYSLIAKELAASNGVVDMLANPSALTAVVTILVPVAIFWFLALLVWRAQELRLMASAMTEVAVRLAEPDKLAEQSVASLGQTIRRQVAAMNDAISRAIGRAGELEALVHNEVTALERSYSENELRVRGLISELASEREALTNNSQRVSESLRGVGAQIARDLSAASGNIDKKLAERGAQLTEILVARSTEAAEQVHQAQNKVQEHMPLLLERLGQEQARLGHVIEGAAKNLSALEVSVGEHTTALDRTLHERTEALTSSLRDRTDALTNSLQERTEMLTSSLQERTDALTTTLASRIKSLETSAAAGAFILDKTLKDRTELLATTIGAQSAALDKTLKDRTEAFATTVGHGAIGFDAILKERTQLLAKSISEESTALDKALKDRTEGFATFVAQGALALDKLLKDRTEGFALSIGHGATGLDQVMKQHTKLLTSSISEESAALDKTLKDRVGQLTAAIGEESTTLDKTLKDRAEYLTAAIGEESTALDKTLRDRVEQLTSVIGEGSTALDKTLRDRTQQLAAFIGQGAAVLDKALKDRTEYLAIAIGHGTQALDTTLKQHGETFNQSVGKQATLLGQSLKERTDAFASSINQGAIALDRTLADRSEAFTNNLIQRSKAVELAIGQQAAAVDKSLADRTEAVTTSLTEQLQTIDTTFSQRTSEVDRVLAEHARAVEQTFGRQAAQLHDLLANNSTALRQTAEQVGAQSKEAVGVLTTQTQSLREVSRGLLEQIHSLTQRFENQGQAILTAAKALDSSNTKIDSILENRHQAIIGLLHAVNTKGQELDTVMRSYAGMVEGALSNAETRAKQVGSALARDTASQAQQALAQIERLREEAQAHTARAVGDLKGSFETVITQIGRQLEQMRGTFDHTSRGMRDAAQKTATDLDTLRQEMQRRMEALPQQTAQATAAIRKALADQLKEIEAITPAALARPQVAGPEPYRRPQLPPRSQPLPHEGAPAPDSGQAPLPPFDARGRHTASVTPGGGDLGSVANNLAQQLSGASHLERRPAPGDGQRAQPQLQPESRQPRREGWSVGDLLSNADAPAYGAAPQRPEPAYTPRGSFTPQPQQPAATAQSLRLDEIARAIDHRTAAEVWQRFRAGERGVLGRHLYSLDGQATFDEISRRYDRDGDFRATVDRYIGDFERLLREAEQTDPEGRMLQNYMTSETGRVYLLLAHASGRLR